jgi:hypothetical protein
MIGRSLTLMDTGAPSPDQVLRLEKAPVSVKASGYRERLVVLSAFSGWVRTLVPEWRARWQPGPVRLWRELAALGLFALNLSWAVPWFRALSAATQEAPPAHSVTVFFGLGLTAYLLVRILNAFRAGAQARRRSLLGLVGIGMAVGLQSLLYTKEVVPLTELIMRPLWALGNFSALIPNELLVFIAVLLVIRRGAVLAVDYLGPGRVLDEFKLGFVMFLVFTGVNTFVTGEQVSSGYLLVYLYAGLIAMGAARQDSVGELRGAARSRLDRRRFFPIFLGAGLTAGGAYLAGLAFSMEGGALAGFVLGAAVLAVFIVSIPLLLVVLYLLYFIVSLFEGEIALAVDRLLGAVDGLLRTLEHLKTLIWQLGELLAERLAFMAPFFRGLLSLAPGVRILVLTGTVALLILFLLAALAIRSRRLREGASAQEQGDIDLHGLIARLRDRMKLRMQIRARSAALLDPDRRRNLVLAARVRRLYARLIRLADRMGHPMGSAQTPAEFAGALGRLLPTETAAILEMTRAYERVRYGELPEDAGEVVRVQRAWMRIRRAAPRVVTRRER